MSLQLCAGEGRKAVTSLGSVGKVAPPKNFLANASPVSAFLPGTADVFDRCSSSLLIKSCSAARSDILPG